MKSPIILIAITVLSLAASLQAQDLRIGALTIGEPWARASAGTAAGAFLNIRNDGEADRLIGVTSEIAGETALHESRMDGGVMQMRHVEGIAVPAHGEVALKPGGYHVMLMGLKAPLKAGDTVPLTLLFQNGGAVRVAVKVEALGAMGPGH